VSAWRTALAPAKLNLRLEILGKRPDGFHELITEMLAIDLADELRARRVAGDGITLALGGPACGADIPADDRNLAWRAVQLVQEEARRRGQREVGLELQLEKQIPSQAGLGGASSDAAAAMLLADALLECGLEREWMGSRLAELGSDCRFFLDAAHGYARCEGRGERVVPFSGAGPDGSIALVTPALACPTPAVFSALRFPLPVLPESAPLGVGHTAPARVRPLGNHLQAAAFRAVAELRPWGAVFERQQAAQWQLSGSGSSFFAVFPSSAEARAGLDRVRAETASLNLGLRLCAVVEPMGHGARLMF